MDEFNEVGGIDRWESWVEEESDCSGVESSREETTGDSISNGEEPCDLKSDLVCVRGRGRRELSRRCFDNAIDFRSSLLE